MLVNFQGNRYGPPFQVILQGRAGSAPVRCAHRSRAGTALISFYRTNVTLTDGRWPADMAVGHRQSTQATLNGGHGAQLGGFMRGLFGIGTARGLQGEGSLADDLYFALLAILRLLKPTMASTGPNIAACRLTFPRPPKNPTRPNRSIKTDLFNGLLRAIGNAVISLKRRLEGRFVGLSRRRCVAGQFRRETGPIARRTRLGRHGRCLLPGELS